MNSQFKNSKIGTILYVSIISVVVLVTILIFWYMLFGYKAGTYSEDTLLGSVYLGGLHENEVNAKINEKYVDWLNDETINYELTYQGYTYRFDRELFSFNIELSMVRLVGGQANELTVEYQDSGTDRQDTITEIESLPYLLGIIDNVDTQRLINDILRDAGLMKTYSSKRVEDYLVDANLSIVDISSITVELPLGFNGNNVLDGITELYGDQYIPVKSKEVYDVIEELSSKLSSSEMTILSRAMLKQLLTTNFSIHEVHYDPIIEFDLYTLESYPHKGSNTYINQVTDSSFSFYNPNNSDYMFKVEFDEDAFELTVTLSGLDFVDTITAEQDVTFIDYITIVSDEVNPAPGYDGMIVIVNRTIIDIYGEELYNNDILFEFYRPVVEIVSVD